jgi:NTP pyrophosphatase (non-canonical NTP hydrolase)
MWCEQKQNLHFISLSFGVRVAYLLLSGEVGEVAQVLKKVHHMQDPRRTESEVQTLEEALTAHRDDIGQELADCLAYIFKLANYTGVDLQRAYLAKMKKNLDRTWKYK